MQAPVIMPCKDDDPRTGLPYDPLLPMDAELFRQSLNQPDALNTFHARTNKVIDKVVAADKKK